MNPKRSLALSALAMIMALAVFTAGTSMAAVVATTKVMETPIDWLTADDNSIKSNLVVSTTTQVFLSWKISDNTEESLILNSMTIDVTLNGVNIEHEFYDTYTFGGKWSRVGICVGGNDTYLNGAMNQDQIQTGLAVLDSSIPYTAATSQPGDIWKLTVTADVASQGPVISYATVTNPIPEPGSVFLALVGFILLLRRRR